MRKPGAALLMLTSLLLLCFLFPAIAGNSFGQSDGVPSPASSGDGDRGAGYLPYSDPTPLGYGGLFGAVVRTIFSLAIVIGLLYATLWLIRKLTGGTAGPASQGNIRVVGRIYLSPKIAVYFLRLLDRLLVRWLLHDDGPRRRSRYADVHDLAHLR